MTAPRAFTAPGANFFLRTAVSFAPETPEARKVRRRLIRDVVLPILCGVEEVG